MGQLKPVAPAYTIPGALERAARDHPANQVLRQGETEMTYQVLLEAVRATAAAVVDAGVRPGEAVALWAPNSIDWAVVSLATLFAGAVVVALNTRYTVTEAADIIDRSGCRLVFAEGEFLGRSLAGEATSLPGDHRVVSLGHGQGRDNGTVPLAGFIDAAVAAPGELDRRLAAMTPADISHIQFTSGTTGRPKGAMLRHEAMVRTTIEWAGVVGLRAGDRYPILSPLSHIGGHKTGLLATITAGATAFPFPTLDIKQLIETIEGEGVTILQGPPTMFHALVSEGRRFPTLRVGVTGAATIPPSLIRQMMDVLGIQSVFTAYGLSESTGVCTITRPGDPVEIIAETSGRPIPGVEVRIAEHGEIAVRGMNVMAGYLNDPAATALAVRDAWLYTGDIGWVGDDGCLRIVDRLKDMVIVGGFNVYPAEVERVLLEHPGVDQAAVVGVPDDRLGEVTVAFVVAAIGHKPSLDDLVGFCRDRLANFKVPRRVWFVEALPLNAAGKVHKPDLRASANDLVAQGD